MSLTLAYVLSYGLVWNRPTQGSFLIFLPPVVVTLLLWVFLFSGMKLDCFGGGWHFPPVFSQVVGICFTQVATTCCVVRRNWIRATTRCRHSLSQADTPLAGFLPSVV